MTREPLTDRTRSFARVPLRRHQSGPEVGPDLRRHTGRRSGATVAQAKAHAAKVQQRIEATRR